MFSVPLVSSDLSGPETILQMGDALKQLGTITEEIFDKIEQKLDQNEQRLDKVDKRIEIVEEKLEQIKKNKGKTELNLCLTTLPKNGSEPDDQPFWQFSNPSALRWSQTKLELKEGTIKPVK